MNDRQMDWLAGFLTGVFLGIVVLVASGRGL